MTRGNLTLPSSWSQLTQLQNLTLDAEYITGSLPDAWSSLTQLTYISLDAHSLWGHLPDSWFNHANLAHLSVGSYCISISLPAPDAWSRLLNLTYISLNSNNLKGVVPEFGPSQQQLTHIQLGFPQLTGSLPDAWSHLTQLTSIEVSGLNVSGTLPHSWSSLQKLMHIKLGSSKIIGTLPDSWSQLTQLTSLHLDCPRINGSLPDSWSSLTALTELSVGDSGRMSTYSEAYSDPFRCFFPQRDPYRHIGSISGALPGNWSALTSLVTLDLASNKMSGTLPPEWSSMTNLSVLVLAYNSLSGSVPSSWSKMSNATELDLSNNSVSLPSSWDGEWQNLRYMDLTGNHINTCSDAFLVNEGYVVDVEASAWQSCKEEVYLKACAYPSTYLYRVSCHAKHYKRTLTLLCCTLGVLLSALCTTFLAYRTIRPRLKPLSPTSNLYNLAQKAKAGWVRAMHWKPWSIKIAALIGLGFFWFDKASDIKLLTAVFSYSYTGLSLLILFIFQYFATAYTLALRLGVHMMRRSFCILFVCTLVPSTLVAFLVGVPAVLVLDVLLFLSDFGLSLACVNTRLDLDEYQMFRDVSRAVFGTLPTVILQSVTFTIATSPDTNLQLTSQVFILSFVAAAAQLLKVVGELFYLSIVRSQSVRCTFWQLFSAANVLQASPGHAKPALPMAGQIQLNSQQSSV